MTDDPSLVPYWNDAVDVLEQLDHVGRQSRTADVIAGGGDQDVLGFGTVADGKWFTARLRSDDTMDKIVPQQSADWRALGVSIGVDAAFKLGTDTAFSRRIR